MFNAGQKEINYIGRLTIKILVSSGNQYYYSDLFPISDLNEMNDKTKILKFFNIEYQKFSLNNSNINPYLKNFKVSPKFLDKEEGPGIYSSNIIYNGEQDKKGTISFEIFDEKKLLENKDFLLI